MTVYAFFEGDFVPQDEAKISILTHAFNYGTGVFDGYRAFWNEEEEQLYLFRLEEHFERFVMNCRMLHIDVPYTVPQLCDIATELALRSELKADTLFRPMGYKSSRALGVRLYDLENSFLISVSPMGAYLDNEHGVRCGTSSWRRVSDTQIPARGKITGLYVNNALARTEAVMNGYDEAVMLTQEGHVSEAGPANIFVYIGGKLVTPAVSEDILVGITRDTVIQLAAKELGIEVVERQVDRSELYVAKEVFLAGTANHLAPVIEVDHHPVGDGKVGELAAELQKVYFQVVRAKREEYQSWCRPTYKTSSPAR